MLHETCTIPAFGLRAFLQTIKKQASGLILADLKIVTMSLRIAHPLQISLQQTVIRLLTVCPPEVRALCSGSAKITS